MVQDRIEELKARIEEYSQKRDKAERERRFRFVEAYQQNIDGMYDEIKQLKKDS